MSAPDEADDEWRFSLDEVGENAEGTDAPEREPLDPGQISLENAVFVLLGVLIAFGILFVTLF